VVELSDLHGTYALLCEAPHRVRVRVGALGEMRLAPGLIVYVGSAHGPGGLGARLGHHCRIPTRPHWHLDYLRSEIGILGAWISPSADLLEHRWAAALASMRGAAAPAAGFGASDCTCRTHLLWFARRPSAERFRRALCSASGGSAPRYLGPKRLSSFTGIAL
jgi:Uri superfamily endonuclease